MFLFLAKFMPHSVTNQPVHVWFSVWFPLFGDNPSLASQIDPLVSLFSGLSLPLSICTVFFFFQVVLQALPKDFSFPLSILCCKCILTEEATRKNTKSQLC